MVRDQVMVAVIVMDTAMVTETVMVTDTATALAVDIVIVMLMDMARKFATDKWTHGVVLMTADWYAPIQVVEMSYNDT